MNLGQLRKAIEGLDDSLDIQVDFEVRDGDDTREIEEGDVLCGSIYSARVETRCNEVPGLYLTCPEFLDEDGASLDPAPQHGTSNGANTT